MKISPSNWNRRTFITPSTLYLKVTIAFNFNKATAKLRNAIRLLKYKRPMGRWHISISLTAMLVRAKIYLKNRITVNSKLQKREWPKIKTQKSRLKMQIARKWVLRFNFLVTMSNLYFILFSHTLVWQTLRLSHKINIFKAFPLIT